MNVSRLAALSPIVALWLASCAGPAYQEIRRPAPGGGTYVERVRLDRRAKSMRPVRKPLPALVPQPQVKPEVKPEVKARQSWWRQRAPKREAMNSAIVHASEASKPVADEAKPADAQADKPSWWSRLRRSSDRKTEPVQELAVVRRKPGTPWWQFGRRAAEPEPEVSYWRGDGVTGSPRIEIALGEQKLRYYRGGQLVGESPVSTGREGFQTVVGRFAICEKDLDHESSMFGDYVDAMGRVVQSDVDARKDPRPAGTRFDGADMRWFMRITGATGMHAGYLPGFPASHGCIRLPAGMAEIFFRETPMGTPVEILP
jgi:hypothetical protein